MGPSMLGSIVWLSLLLATTNHFSASAQLVNTTLHSTHPQVAYAPESCCIKDIFGGCMKRYDPFTKSTYVDPESRKRTFFQTSSWGNEPKSSIMKRRVEIVFHGRAVYVYGPPRAQLDNLPGHIQIFLNGIIMRTIDLESKYREADNEPWNPLLMYHWEGGGGDATHSLEITLLDDATGFWSWFPIRGFGFDSVVYTSSEPWYPRPKYELSESEKLENVTIHDTNFVTSFTPSYAWEKQISAVASSEGIRTFHGTSNELAYNSRLSGATPVAEFSAQCAELAVYGASLAQLEATFAGGFRHGHLQICQGTNCEYIDAHQAYLNVPEHLWNEPVLLYTTDRMWPHSVKAVTMRLLDPSSPVGHLWTMTFSHAICSQVVPRWPWTHPIQNGHYSNHSVQYHRLDYAPSFVFGVFSPWSWADLYSFAAAKRYWFFGLIGDLPSWSTIVQGHDIKIFVPFPTLFPSSRYANVRCCIDGHCHYPDVEQWFLKARDAPSNVPLVHYQDLNPFRDHHISMTVVRRSDEAGDKIIAVSQIVYEQVVVAPQPSPTPTPSKPIEHPQLPSPKKPTKDEDDSFRAFALAALAIVILMSIGWCFALVLLKDAQRRRPERQRLLSPQSRPQAQLWPPPGIRPSDFSSEINRMRSERAVNSRPDLPPAGRSFNPEPRTTTVDRNDERSAFSSEIDRLRFKFVPTASPGSPSNPANSQSRTPGPSNRNSNVGPSFISGNYNGEGSTYSIAEWIENTNSHHHGPRPFSPSGPDGRFRLVPTSDYPGRTLGSSHSAVPSGYRPASPLSSTPYRSSGPQRQPSRGASSSTVRDTQPSFPTYTESDIPPPYSDHSAPPSYDACVTTDAAITSPPPPHAPITAPTPPPPRWTEPAARLSTVSEQPDVPQGTRGGAQQNNEQPGPSHPQAEGSTGRGGRRSRRHQQQPAEIAGPSLPPPEASDNPRGRVRGRGRGSGRGRGRGRRGRGGSSGST